MIDLLASRRDSTGHAKSRFVDPGDSKGIFKLVIASVYQMTILMGFSEHKPTLTLGQQAPVTSRHLDDRFSNRMAITDNRLLSHT